MIVRIIILSLVLAFLSISANRAEAQQVDIYKDLPLYKELPNLKIEKEFHLYTTDGYQEMANGESIYVWGFTHAEDFADVGEIKTKEERELKLLPVKAPGDELRLQSGKNYAIVLHNAGWYETEKGCGANNVAHTIHFHGMDLIPAMDGVPDLPTAPVFPGKTFRYILTIPKDLEGTYIGHCHVDSTNHIMAGMYFPIVIEKEPHSIYGHYFDREYTLFFSEMDSNYMEGLRTQGTLNRCLDWKSNYFMLNGRIYTNKLDNPLSTINDPKTRLVAYEGETVLVRLCAIGYDHTFVWHPHGYHGLVIGTDGRKLPYPYEKDTLPITSGERYELLYKIPDFASQRKCLSCNLGPGLTVAHDHNMMGMASEGVYPFGPLTIFDTRPRPKE